MSGLTLASVALYLFLAFKVFKEDKILYIYDNAQSKMKTLGSEIDNRLQKNIFLVNAIQNNHLVQAQSSEIFRIWKVNDQSFDRTELVNIYQNPDPSRALDPVQYNEAWVKNIWYKKSKQLNQLAKAQVLSVQTFYRELDSDINAPLVYWIVLAMGEGQFVLAEVDLTPILDRLNSDKNQVTFMTDGQGAFLGHSIQSRIFSEPEPFEQQVIDAAQASSVRQEVRTYNRQASDNLVAYYKLELPGLTLFSQTDLALAFSAIRLLVEKSVLYAIFVVLISFIVSLFFSQGLTHPIEILVEATRRISQGNLEQSIQIHSNDELALLSESFNKMTTDLKESRQKVEEYSRDLEHKVAERTSQLEAQKDTIQEAKEALIRSTRLASVGEVAGRAAHEVLNPLTSISGKMEKIYHQSLQAVENDQRFFKEMILFWVQEIEKGGISGLIESWKKQSSVLQGKILLEEDVSNLVALSIDQDQRILQMRSDVQQALMDCQRIAKIVNGMRSLTRVSTEKRRVDLVDFLSNFKKSSADLFAKGGLQFEIRMGTGPCYTWMDPDEGLQILDNLVRNSIHALQSGHKKDGKIEIVLREEDESFALEVRDNGPGIGENDRGRIFESGFSTKTAEQGTGLGLSISRRLARGMDGDLVLLKSVPDGETIFVITLPKWKADSERVAS